MKQPKPNKLDQAFNLLAKAVVEPNTEQKEALIEGFLIGVMDFLVGPVDKLSKAEHTPPHEQP